MNKTLFSALAASLITAASLFGCTSTGDNESAVANSSSNSSSATQDEAQSSSSAAVSAKPSTKDNDMENSSLTATLTIKGVRFAIDLADNDTAAAFADMLPLKVDMSELNGNEKYVYLDNELPANATNPKTIEAGDVMLYGNDCVVVFYKSHPTTYTYTRIGKIADISNLAKTLGSGSIEAEFTLG